MAKIISVNTSKAIPGHIDVIVEGYKNYILHIPADDSPSNAEIESRIKAKLAEIDEVEAINAQPAQPAVPAFDIDSLKNAFEGMNI